MGGEGELGSEVEEWWWGRLSDSTAEGDGDINPKNYSPNNSSRTSTTTALEQ